MSKEFHDTMPMLTLPMIAVSRSISDAVYTTFEYIIVLSSPGCLAGWLAGWLPSYFCFFSERLSIAYMHESIAPVEETTGPHRVEKK